MRQFRLMVTYGGSGTGKSHLLTCQGGGHAPRWHATGSAHDEDELRFLTFSLWPLWSTDNTDALPVEVISKRGL
jgi:hypothetical protein